MNVIKEIERINSEELRLGISEERSWHAEYRGSAWVFVGGLDHRLTEGDVIAVMSQWGEIEDIHLIRDESTGKSKGFAFLKYEDWRSTVLAVDNVNGYELLGRTLRVDHKLSYEPPKSKKGTEEQLAAEEMAKQGIVREMAPGHAYENKEKASAFDIHSGVNLFAKAVPAPQPAELDSYRGPAVDEEAKVASAIRDEDDGDAKERHRRRRHRSDREASAGRGGDDCDDDGKRHGHHPRSHRRHHHRHGGEDADDDGRRRRREHERGSARSRSRSRSRSRDRRQRSGSRDRSPYRQDDRRPRYSESRVDAGGPALARGFPDSAAAGASSSVSAGAPSSVSASARAGGGWAPPPAAGPAGGGFGRDGGPPPALSWRGRLDASAQAPSGSAPPMRSGFGGGSGGSLGGPPRVSSGVDHVAGMGRRR